MFSFLKPFKTSLERIWLNVLIENVKLSNYKRFYKQFRTWIILICKNKIDNLSATTTLQRDLKQMGLESSCHSS